jgi:hypothetical protein
MLFAGMGIRFVEKDGVKTLNGNKADLCLNVSGAEASRVNVCFPDTR